MATDAMRDSIHIIKNCHHYTDNDIQTAISTLIGHSGMCLIRGDGYSGSDLQTDTQYLGKLLK